MANALRNKLTAVREQVKEAYENQATLREIAEVHGVSAGTVRNCLVELNVDLRPRGRRKADPAKVAEKAASDERMIPIADEAPVEAPVEVQE